MNKVNVLVENSPSASEGDIVSKGRGYPPFRAWAPPDATILEILDSAEVQRAVTAIELYIRES